MRKLTILAVVFAIPFILVWMSFVLTGASFHPHTVFKDGAFWGISCIYWFLVLMLIPIILQVIDEIKPAK